MSTAEDMGVTSARERVRLAETLLLRAQANLDNARSTLKWAIQQAERASPATLPPSGAESPTQQG